MCQTIPIRITRTNLRNAILALTVTTLVTAGCATTRGGGTQASADTGDDSECSAGTAALVGGVLGALLADGKNRVRGAALGAGLASLACVAWNYNSKQTKTAAQVQQGYMAANQGQIPTRSRVTRYDTQLGSGGKVSPGGKMVVTSNIEVVQGSADKTVLIEEEMLLKRPDGKDIKGRKVASDKEGGGYSTTFSIALPEGVQQGEYPVQTNLYVNGEKASSKTMKMQVVTLPGSETLALLK